MKMKLKIRADMHNYKLKHTCTYRQKLSLKNEYTMCNVVAWVT